MSKSDAILKNVDLDKVFYDQNDPDWANGKQVNAFDTETSNGSVFMVSYAFGDKSGYIGNEYGNELSSEEIFNILTNYQARSSLNFWYNLDFDANAILSGVLSQRELTVLSLQDEVTTTHNGNEYDITYVKSKFLKIQDDNNNNYEHYDVSQFFYTTLDSAAEEWLGENKTEGVDTSKFGSSVCKQHSNPESDSEDKPKKDCHKCVTRKEAKDYIRENYDKIAEYAEKDAILTQELSQELVTQAEKLNVPMGKPFSTGYLSAEYLRANTPEKPGFNKFDYQDMFWDSYYGGRFEVFERGDIGEIVAPDINSAYPAIMRNLPDPSSLNWEHFSNEPQPENEGFTFSAKPFSFSEITEHDYGVIRAIVTTNPKKKIQPFAYKLEGKVNFPVLTDTEITVIKPIFEFAVKNDYVVDYRLKEAWLATETDKTHYPFDFIGDVYAERKVAEVLNDLSKKGQLLKIVLNSLYGKTCQTTEKKKLVDVREKPDDWELAHNEKLIPMQYLSKVQREKVGENEVIISRQQAGRRFNPFIASYITGMTRLELHKRVEEYGLVDDTVMFATDCIMVRKSAYESSDFEELINVPNENLPESQFREKAQNSLGFWDFDYEGKAFIVGSGVYEVDTGNCRDRDCENYGEWCDKAAHRTKTKTRGFTEKDIGKTLKQSAQDNKHYIPIQNERPLTIGEVLINPDKGSVSEFIRHSKKLFPDFDSKRVWERESPTFHDLLESAEESKPRNLADEQEKRLREVQQDSSRIEETSITANLENGRIPD